MSFEDEWRQLKEDAAAKSSGMRLNGLPAMDPGGPRYPASGGTAPAPDYVVQRDDLGAIGHDAFLLFNGMESGGKHAKVESEAAAAALKAENFAMGAALATVNKTWETQVKSLMQACAHISNHLDYTAKSSKQDDEWIETDLKRISVSKLSEYFK
ncbi:hypothetical protein [Streptomyces corynorhini]|uniref:Uncharacterized protein n=1 Tax=Streptomyces corynorhini TaxID=2282652 RepID=A0A370BFY7_9ACTN|nr:hypothetical protein [Streptomyces corynorhini]RDG38596.1 hypothetical protein DVH02_08405 [Streptomyces corynorhini]